MVDKSVYTLPNIGVSLIGGAASAAVYAVLATLSTPAILMAHLSPLPLMIVGLGFGVGHAATSALLATVLLSLVPQHLPLGLEEWRFGMAYAMIVAAPSWLSIYAFSGAPLAGRDRLTRNLSAYAALAPAVALALAAGGALGAAVWQQGSLGEALGYVRGEILLWLTHFGRAMEFGSEFDPKSLSAPFTRAAPGALISYWIIILMANLWLAMQLCRLSSLMPGPKRDIALDFVLPRSIAIAFGLFFGLSFIDGLAGVEAHIAASALGVTLLLQGLAVAHAYLRASKSGVLVLSIIYFVGGLVGWPMLLLLGIVDTVFNFRSKISSTPQAGGRSGAAL